MNTDTFPNYLNDFVQKLQQEGKSAHTIAAYQRDLQQLFSLLPPAAECKKTVFASVLRKLSQQNQSPRSLARKVSAWRQYGDFLVRQNLLAANPIASLKTPKIPPLLPKAMSAEPLNHVFNHAQSTDDDELATRDLAMFELLYGCGLRLSELQSLDLKDILLDEGWVSVLGKGKKMRQVPVGKSALNAVRQYLSERVAASDETALFTNKHGKRISTRQIQYRLRDWAIKHHSSEHLHPHKLRHSYASHVLQAAGDIRAVQELLGHSSLSTTQIYTKLDFDHLAKVYDQTHPRAKKKKD
ncbi:MAG: tyrosine recombinase XerC [Neisseria sp.]|nr:tyrosine recombinase XerC [Neisseria sp.]